MDGLADQLDLLTFLSENFPIHISYTTNTLFNGQFSIPSGLSENTHKKNTPTNRKLYYINLDFIECSK